MDIEETYLDIKTIYNKLTANIILKGEKLKVFICLLNKWCWENWIATTIRIKLDHCLTPSTKFNLKWIKELNIKPETIKLLEENISGKLLDISLGGDFLSLKPKAAKATNKQTSGILSKYSA